MNTIELSYEDKCACNSDRFCKFVEDYGVFNSEEVRQLQASILNKKLSKTLYVSAALATWSMLAAWVDGLILPFVIIYTLALPGAQYYPLLFPVIFTIVNATLKFIFIRQRLGNVITLRDNFLAVLPYAGAAFILKGWFVGDPLLRKASLAYLKHQKSLVIQKVTGVFKNRSSHS